MRAVYCKYYSNNIADITDNEHTAYWLHTHVNHTYYHCYLAAPHCY